MEIDHRSAALRSVARSALGAATQRFSLALGSSAERRGGPLVVGTEAGEPWHFVSHLEREAQLRGRADLAPTWVRWRVPERAPAHLGCGVDDLRGLAPHRTLLVVSEVPDVRLLERVDDARRRGATVFSLQGCDPALTSMSHEHLVAPAPVFDDLQHLVTELTPLDADGGARLVDRLARSRWAPPIRRAARGGSPGR